MKNLFLSKPEKSSFFHKRSVICEKLANMFIDYDPSSCGINELEKRLSVPKAMKETFLNPDFLEDYFKENIKEEDLLNDNYDMLDFSATRKKTKFPVKLVVSEITKSKKSKNLRRFVSPFMKIIPDIDSEFGWFHSALIVGPWYLEW
jgi:hypothetical protein